MSSPQRRTTLQCPNCGGSMTIEFAGDLNDKQMICQYCHTAFDVPDNFERVRKVRREQKGLFRKREVVEEVIHERRSDFNPAQQAPPQPQFHQQQGQPIVVNIPGFNIGPGGRQVQQTSGGSCIGSLIVLMFVCVLTVGIVGAVLVSLAADQRPDLPFGLNDVLDDISSEIGVKSVPQRSPIREVGGHSISVEAVAFSPDGTRFVTVELLGVMRLWDAETYGLILEYDDDLTGVDSVDFVQDSSTLIGINSRGSVLQWDSSTGEQLRTLNANRTHLAIFRPDGLEYAAVTYDNYGLAIRTLPNQNTVSTGEIGVWIDGGAYSPSGDYLAMMASGGDLFIWETETWRLIYEDETIATSFDSVAFVPGSDTLVVGNNEELQIFEIANSAVSRPETWEVKDDMISDSLLLSIEGLAFSPDGKYMAIGNFFNDAYLFDFEERTQVLELTCDCTPSSLDFNGDGTRLIGGGSGNVVIWDVSNPEE